MSIEDFSIPLESGLRELTDEERKMFELDDEAKQRLDERMADIRRCQLYAMARAQTYYVGSKR